jgi:hypothetical protein
MYPSALGVQLTRAPGRGAWGVSFLPLCSQPVKDQSMVESSPPIHFEDVPIDIARAIGRGPRMDPGLYHAFKNKIQSLDNTATRISIPDGTSPATMKNRILRVAAELQIPVTIRKVPGGLLFWRSTNEDVQQAKEVAGRLQNGRRQQGARPGRRRRA